MTFQLRITGLEQKLHLEKVMLMGNQTQGSNTGFESLMTPCCVKPNERSKICRVAGFTSIMRVNFFPPKKLNKHIN